MHSASYDGSLLYFMHFFPISLQIISSWGSLLKCGWTLTQCKHGLELYTEKRTPSFLPVSFLLVACIVKNWRISKYNLRYFSLILMIRNSRKFISCVLIKIMRSKIVIMLKHAFSYFDYFLGREKTNIVRTLWCREIDLIWMVRRLR